MVVLTVGLVVVVVLVVLMLIVLLTLWQMDVSSPVP